ncbi:hypothetical protein [Clostridium folliculivorans]|uniref:hypothetical protein n=1 Tax=Clostridium folliculivorans TaxID=2886038 RepID=UPI0021C41A0C|nr:hypothetical protein [Clostridium folliculivorans]GKU29322.1 hypothetical protein CFB3_14280 [Clostridium folliculivorans]
MNLYFNLQVIVEYKNSLKKLNLELEQISREFQHSSLLIEKNLNIEQVSYRLKELQSDIGNIEETILRHSKLIEEVERAYAKLLNENTSSIPHENSNQYKKNLLESSVTNDLLSLITIYNIKKTLLPYFLPPHSQISVSKNLFVESGGIVPDWVINRSESNSVSLNNDFYVSVNRNYYEYNEEIKKTLSSAEIKDNNTFTINLMRSMNASLDFIKENQIRYSLDIDGKDNGWFPMDKDEIRNFANNGMPSIAVCKNHEYKDTIFTIPPISDEYSNSKIFVYDITSAAHQLKEVDNLILQGNEQITYYAHR